MLGGFAKKYGYALLGALGLAGAGTCLVICARIRLYNIDELNYLQAAWLIGKEGWQFGRDYFFGAQTTLLQFFLSSLVGILGDGGLFRFRLVFIAFSLLTMLLVFVLWKRLELRRIEWRLPLFLVTLLSLPFFTLKAFEVRNEPLQIFLFMAALISLQHWFKTGRLHWVCLASAAATVMFWLKVTTGIYFLAIPLAGFFYSKNRRRFAAAFAAASVAATVMVMWKWIVVMGPYIGDFLTRRSAEMERIPASRLLLYAFGKQPWFWAPLLILSVAALHRNSRSVRPFLFMTILPSVATLLVISLKKLVNLQDLLMPAFGLILGVSLGIGESEPGNGRGRMGALAAIVLAAAGLNVFSLVNTIKCEPWPDRKNPFPLYHHYVDCAGGRALPFSKFVPCFSALLRIDPYGNLQFSPSRQMALNAFLRENTRSGELTVSATMQNVFCPQTQAWLPARMVLADFDPAYLARLIRNGGPFHFEYDMLTDLKASPPKLITLDSYLIKHLSLDPEAEAFLDKNYEVIYLFQSQSFLAVHKLLGRRLLRDWNATRLLGDGADRLTAGAIDGKGEPRALLSEALRLSPNHPEANYLVGKYLWENGESKEAEEHLIRALGSADYTDVDALLLLVRKFELSGERYRKVSDALKLLRSWIPDASLPCFSRETDPNWR